jgi:hypothetical protein
MNVMWMESEYEGPDYLVCDSIEECMWFEQHHLNVMHRVRQEDLAVENREYGNILLLNRMVYMLSKVCVYIMYMYMYVT